MCVIFGVHEDRPTENMVSRAWDRNKDGGGLAWREKAPNGDVMVHYKKNVGLEEMQEKCASLPIPYVAHFRIASTSGGGKLPELCHPFEISLKTPAIVEGVTKNRVLFHNGDWSAWREAMLKAIIRMGVPVPEGKWSDTRAMAFLCSIFGPNLMDVIDQKGIMFGTEEFEYFTGSGWFEINKVWCSNDLFWGGVRLGSMCRANGCSETNGLDADVRCAKHRKRLPTNPTHPSDEPSEAEIGQALMRMHDHPNRVSQYPAKAKKHKAAGSGGDQQNSPFPSEIVALIEVGAISQAIRTAEEMRLRHPEKLSKNKLKKIRRQLTGMTLQPFYQNEATSSASLLVLEDPNIVLPTSTVH